jgi:hypothetical protein
MAKSPSHYKQAVDEDIGESIGRYTKERGSALHSLVLGGPQVIKYTGKVRRGKDWEEFQKQQPSSSYILTAKEYEKTHAMAAKVRSCVPAQPFLRGEHEKEVHWSWLGRECVSHIDILGKNFVAEIKTCESSHPQRFRWMSLKYGYHAQLAFYKLAAFNAGIFTGPWESINCYVIAVESKAPYPVSAIRMKPELISQGEMMCRSWMERLLVCEESNQWPEYTSTVEEMEAPEEDPELEFPDEVTSEDS